MILEEEVDGLIRRSAMASACACRLAELAFPGRIDTEVIRLLFMALREASEPGLERLWEGIAHPEPT